MSRHSRKRARESKDEDEEELYTRADASLWDDSELVKIWNAQVGAVPSVQDSQGSPGSQDTNASVSASDVESSEESSRASSENRDKDQAGSALSLAHLPKDVRNLAQSFFNAGYQAGLFAASSRAKK